MVKAPKIYLNDTGLLCQLRGTDTASLVKTPNFPGQILENFVVMELIKQQGWNNTKCKIYHFRSQTGQEVDFLLEAYDGRIVGIEVKTSSEVGVKDFAGLEYLAKLTGNDFIRGMVLYTGNHTVKFAKNLFAVPITTLWQGKI